MRLGELCAAMDSTSTSIEALNSLLRGELSAIEAYRYTLRCTMRPRTRSQLEDCLQSHERRAQLLRRRIKGLGGNPARGAGTWGAVVRALVSYAVLFGPAVAITTLEAGEEYGRLEYVRKLTRLDDPGSRGLVEAQLIPAQVLTHEWITDLKRTTSGAYAAHRAAP